MIHTFNFVNREILILAEYLRLSFYRGLCHINVNFQTVGYPYPSRGGFLVSWKNKKLSQITLKWVIWDSFLNFIILTFS